MKISIYKRLFSIYKILGETFGSWISPIFTGFLLLILRFIVFLGSIIDYLCFSKIRKGKIKRPILIVGNPRSGTTFLHHYLTKNNLGTGSQLWQMIYPSIILQKIIKPILPLLEYISPAKHHSTDAHKTNLTAVETDDVGILFRFFDGFFLYGFLLSWSNDDLFDWVDPKLRDNSKRDYKWLESVWKRILVSSKLKGVLS